MDNEVKNVEDNVRGRESGFIDLVCERAILGLLLLILVFGPLALGAVRPLEFSIIQGLTLLILALWGLRVWLNRRYRFFLPPICWAVMAVTLYSIIRANLAEMPPIARQEMYQVLVYATLFFAIINNVNRRDSAAIVTITLILLAVGLSCFAFYQVATQCPHIWNFTKPAGYCGRGTGTYINPNHLAGFLEMILPLTLAFTLMGRFKHAAKALLGYAALMIAAGIGVSLSRGGIVAAGAAIVLLLIVLLFQRDYTFIAAIMLVLIAVLGGVFSSQLPQTQIRFAHTQIVENKREDDRILYWRAALELSQRNAIWGIGSGHFNQESWPYRPAGNGRMEYAHNDYLQTLCEWGSVGLALIGSALALLFIGVKKTWQFVRPDPKELGSKTNTKAAFLLGGACGLFAILIHSFVDFNMHIPANALLAIVLIALLTAQLRFATDRFWVKPGILWKGAFTALALVGMGFMGSQACQQARAGIVLQRAESPDLDFSARVALLKEAAKIEPENFETAFALGECLRLQSWQGKEGYRLLAQEALTWFRRAMDLNPYDPFCPLRYGMCLDWLDRAPEATPYFKSASALDPHGDYVATYEGWHYIQLEDYPAAKKSLERSLKYWYTDLAAYYLNVVKAKIAEGSNKKAK